MSSDAKNYVYLQSSSPQHRIADTHSWVWVVFHLLGGLWGCSPVIPPDGGAGAYPGLTHSAVLGCATTVKGKALNILPRWTTCHLPWCTCSLSFPATFCFLLAQSAQAWPCPALARFWRVSAGMVKGMSPLQCDLPWPHQWAHPEDDVYRVSHCSRSLKTENTAFAPSFFPVLHLFFIEFS